MCGCQNNQQLTAEQVQAQKEKVEMLRAQATAIANAPAVAAGRVIKAMSNYRCTGEADCPPGTKCYNGKCITTGAVGALRATRF